MYIAIAPIPDMKDLMDALYHTVADKWEPIGIYLHLPMATLKTITAEHQHDPRKCLIGMLDAWLKRVHPPPIYLACYCCSCGVFGGGAACTRTYR